MNLDLLLHKLLARLQTQDAVFIWNPTHFGRSIDVLHTEMHLGQIATALGVCKNTVKRYRGVQRKIDE